MGKPTGKIKKPGAGSKAGDENGKQAKPIPDRSSKAFDKDTEVFITMSQELKEEGKKLFQKLDHEGAMLKYEKALKLLPKNHIDVAYLRSNMALCFMQIGIGEYPRAIIECNLALEVAPKYSRALLRRAKCYEALNRLDLAMQDVNSVLSIEPNNLTALEISDRLRNVAESKGIVFEDREIDWGTKDSRSSSNHVLKFKKVLKEKVRRKKKNNVEDKDIRMEDKVVVQEEKRVTTAKEEKKVAAVKEEKAIAKTVKLVFGEDIRFVQLPVGCSIGLVREIVRDRFLSLKGVLVKYMDKDGDLVTITTTAELRMAESSSDLPGSLKLYIVEISPDKEPCYEGMSEMNNEKVTVQGKNKETTSPRKEVEESSCSIDNWIVQFARLFKNHVGFNSDSYRDLHELGMKLYSEAMEDTVTNEDAEELFEIAATQFQEMAALALFNWGNVHMSKAKKRIFFSEDGSRESVLAQIKTAYEWSEKEYARAGMRYEEAIKIKPDFYEGLLALGQQQFEQAKLTWYYTLGNKGDLEVGPSTEVLMLYNKAEDSMERGMLMWEELEEQRLNGISKEEEYKSQLQKMGLDGLFKEISPDEAAEQAANMRSQTYLLWGTLLYERSIVEFKLGLPVWEECLEVAVEKFELAGATPTDIAVMLKNHCSNGAALDGLGFKIDEIVQAWNEMYDAKRWQTGVPSFRLEPLFRRRVPNLQYMEHI